MSTVKHPGEQIPASTGPANTLQWRAISIPIEVVQDERLTWNERVLIVLIDMLDNDSYCFASNSYLAELMGMSYGGVANALTKLKRLQWIREVPSDKGARKLTTALRDARMGIHTAICLLGSENRTSNDESHVHQMMNHIYDNDYRRKEEEEERSASAPTATEKALEVYKEFFPDYNPTAYQLEKYFSTVTELSVWKSVCENWAGRGYKARNIAGLADTYRKGLQEPQNGNGNRVPSSRPAVIEDGCPFCTAEPPRSCPVHKGGSK